MKNKNHLPALAMAIIFILFIGCKKEESGAKINYGTGRTMMDSRKIRPEGWHVASNQDWRKYMEYP